MKRFYGVVYMFVAALLLWSCGPAEVESTIEYDVQGLYTVNKATVSPEFSDTMLFVQNMDSYGLKTGDRAFLRLHGYFDLYSSKSAVWNITEVLEMVPVRRLSSKADVNPAEYTTPVLELQPVNFFDEFVAYTWVHKGLQNVSIKYNGEKEDASYAMTVRGLDKDGNVEMDLYVNAQEGTQTNAVLLTFDLSDVADFLTDEEKAQLPDDIKTVVYAKRMNNGVLQDWKLPGEYIRR